MKSRDRVRVGAVGYCVLGAMLGIACSGGHEGDYAEGEHGEYTDTIVDEFGGEKPGETALPEGTRKLADVLDEAMADTAEVQSAAVDNTYAVGVIPIDGSTCPSGSSLIKIYMDDEDDENRSFATGWHLPQTLKDVPRRTNWSGTNLRFCKVNGSSFRPLTTDVSKKAYFYATLKLGQYCPNGSVEITRHIDNEDDKNRNSYSGPLSPNAVGINTRLHFCFFRTGSPTMSSFPNLGVDYAVFHDYDGDQPSLFKRKAWIFSDDEDDDNANSQPTSSSAQIDFSKLVGGGKNTMFDLGRVR